nr:hypothetical protein [Tanacetum cinerariifolium]
MNNFSPSLLSYPAATTTERTTTTARRLYLSSTSSTLILDNEQIPEVKHFKTDRSGAEFSKENFLVCCSEAKANTLENLLMWAWNRKHDSATFHCTVNIDNVRTKRGWNFPSCCGEKCRKSVTRSSGNFYCESRNKHVEYPVLRYMLEFKVSDDTTEVVEDGDEHSPLPYALANIMGAGHTLEFRRHTYYEHNTYESFTCWRIVTAEGVGESGGSSATNAHPVFETLEFKGFLRRSLIATSSKPSEDKKHKRQDLEESDVGASFVVDTQTGSGVGGSRPDTRKNKRPVHRNKKETGSFRKRKTTNTPKQAALTSKGAKVSYHNIGAPSYQCANCQASMWNRMGAFIDKDNGDRVDATSVQSLIQTLDWYSSVAKAFRMARDWCHSQASVNVELHLLSKRTNARQYNKPTMADVEALITNDFGDGIPSRDIIDVMALCRTYRNPDLFITFTSNPKWPEIGEMIAYFPRQKAHDRPEVETRVFNMKLTELLHDLTKNQIFRATKAVLYVIEFQKWVLPHAHILLWLEDHCKCKTTTQIDDIISVELRSPTDDPDGYKAVTNYMLHGTCGKDGRYAPCTTKACHLNYGKKPGNFCRRIFYKAKGNYLDFQDLPRPNPQLLTNIDNCLIREALDFDMNESKLEHETLHPLLNPKQRLIYEQDDEYLKERAILTPRSDDAYAINVYMFNKLAGKSVTYNSADEICKASTETLDQQQLYPTEFLNT